jgi:hypothetical protein
MKAGTNSAFLNTGRQNHALGRLDLKNDNAYIRPSGKNDRV